MNLAHADNSCLQAPYLAEDGLLFIVLGIISGIGGSFFNYVNLHVAKFRRSVRHCIVQSMVTISLLLSRVVS